LKSALTGGGGPHAYRDGDTGDFPGVGPLNWRQLETGTPALPLSKKVFHVACMRGGNPFSICASAWKRFSFWGVAQSALQKHPGYDLILMRACR
jgi:hypothetical protein